MIPARVEVTETDGSTFADITATARKNTQPLTCRNPNRLTRPGCGSGREGFAPGEDIAVCRIIRTPMRPTGTACALIDLAHDHTHWRRVVLVAGRASSRAAAALRHRADRLIGDRIDQRRHDRLTRCSRSLSPIARGRSVTAFLTGTAQPAVGPRWGRRAVQPRDPATALEAEGLNAVLLIVAVALLAPLAW